MKVGLYYSPAQFGSVKMNAKEYDDYFINQISELLSNYGKIDYLWFDGCGSENHVYDHARIVNAIGEMQPDILTLCDPEWTPGVRWVGNEDGYASLNNPLVVSSTDFSELAKEEQQLSKPAFLPAECDCKMRHTWFYDINEDTIKSVEELFGMYEMSVGHGSNLLINIGPDNRGLLPDADVKQLLELGKRIKENYSEPLDFTEPQKDGDVYTLGNNNVAKPDWMMPLESRLSNCVCIQEDLTNGQSVESFSVYGYLPEYRHKKILLFEGKTIGHKVLCKFSPLRASKYEIVINEHSGDYTIKDNSCYITTILLLTK